MANDVSYLTAEGAQKIREELEYLKGPAREDLAKRLRAAIELGDLSENADYIQAKEEQGFLEGRIQELESILRNMVIIDELKQDLNEVGVGDHVTIQEDGFPEETYFIVGPKEADPANFRISHLSPIGKSLIGKKVGDIAIAQTPAGEIEMKVVRIE
jgi:transcription elongation factor GreA